MASYNRVILMGNLTREVQLRQAGSSQVANFAIAINEKRRQGDAWIDDVVFVNCTAWGRTAEVLEQYARKGDPIHIEGRLQINQWEKDGQKRAELRVVVDRLQLVKARSMSGDAVPLSEPHVTGDGGPIPF